MAAFGPVELIVAKDKPWQYYCDFLLFYNYTDASYYPNFFPYCKRAVNHPK